MRPMADVSTAARTKHRQGHGQEGVQLVPADERQSERRQPLRDLPEQRDALRLEVQEPRREHAGEHHEKRHGPVLQPELAGDERREGSGSHQQRGLVRLAQVRDEVGRALPEVSVRAFEAEQLRELRARQVERQPRFEADEHGFGEEADGVAGANEPGRNRDERPRCSADARGKRGVARGIAAAQFAHRRADRAATTRR